MISVQKSLFPEFEDELFNQSDKQTISIKHKSDPDLDIRCQVLVDEDFYEAALERLGYFIVTES